MKHKKILLLAILSLIICKVASSEIRSKPLKGIEKIWVLIEVLGEEERKMGLTEDRLKSITELRLRREGIQICSREEWFSHNNIPWLYVNVVVVGRAFNVLLELKDYVSLHRDRSISCYASTWSQDITGTSNNPEYIVSALSELLDEFINDYYIANPKKQ